ncbi:MAG: hypothetical protein WBM17_01270 [Anaerolineales bacterium]
MAEIQIVQNMRESIAARAEPAITRWNRLEGRPRTHNFDRALRAEIRDAIWMLSRQWQMGEFEGDDAGSPVLARVCIDVSAINAYQAGRGTVNPLSLAEPLEARAERRPLPLRIGGQNLSLDLRLVVGRYWLKLLAREAARLGGLSADYHLIYRTLYPVHAPDPNLKTDAVVCAHPEAWRAASAAAGRMMDGIAFLEYLANPAHHAYDGVGAASSDEVKLTALADKLLRWFKELIQQPTGEGEDAWLPDRLEYQFGVSAPNLNASESDHDLVMRAEAYDQGNLDWYALERRPDQAHLGATVPPAPALARHTHTFLPSSIIFEGMPDTRWWAFEDRRTNFGQIQPDTTDLGKLLLMEFGLVYANDWFVLPYTLPIGCVAEVKGIAVSSVFGERFWVEPVREQPGTSWEKWSLFTLGTSVSERQTPPSRLVLLPTSTKVQESPAIEEISLIRDEVANMVWAIEQRILLSSGTTKPGSDSAREYHNYLQHLIRIPVAPPEFLAPIRYQVMNTVPENWIPFIPSHVDGDVREIQLQRAALPRFLDGNPDPPEKIRPRTTLVSTNLPHAYLLHEEEVPRAGSVVRQAYQRTRWIGGKVFTWFGAQKQTGRGEGSSGLKFDGLVDKKK